MPKKVDPLERRAAIAEAAVTSIARHGFDGAKLSVIARTAGVTTGAVAHYFNDKDEVLLAALDLLAQRLLDRIAVADVRSAEDQLGDVLPLDEGSLDEWRVWIAFWGRAAFVPALARVHRAHYESIESALAAAIGGDTAQLDAAAVIAAIDGIGTRVSLEPEQWPPARQRGLLAHILRPIFTQGEHHARTRPSVG